MYSSVSYNWRLLLETLFRPTVPEKKEVDPNHEEDDLLSAIDQFLDEGVIMLEQVTDDPKIKETEKNKPNKEPKKTIKKNRTKKTKKKLIDKKKKKSTTPLLVNPKVIHLFLQN